jgi:starch synthase
LDDGSLKLAPLLSPKLVKQNALLRGILYADAINTVSPTHAVEVLTAEYAEGLELPLQKVSRKLTGILNGIDTNEFNPATDPLIKKTFTKRGISGRKQNKLDLQKIFSLPQDNHRPLLAFTGRLSQQKGLDLLLEVLPHLFHNKLDVQVVFLGRGEERFREKLTLLSQKYPHQLGLHLQADFTLSHKLFAGADMFLIPSYFDPGGIVALEALRYGAIPIVRRTGGLNDIVSDFDGELCLGNGFSFREKDPWAFYGAIIEALTLYNQPHLWRKLVQNALSCDFSWRNAAKKYSSWYRQVYQEFKGK